MGQAERTTKLLLDFAEKEKGGANRSKRAALAATSEVLNQARGFYLSFFLAHPDKLFERVQLVNQETGKDCIGKAKAYYTTHEQWRASGKKKGKPGLPTPRNHPTLSAGVFALQLDQVDVKKSWVSLRVYRGKDWAWVNYPVCENRYFEARMADPDWKPLAPKLVVKQKRVEIHFPQEMTVRAKKIRESKRDPDWSCGGSRS